MCLGIISPLAIVFFSTGLAYAGAQRSEVKELLEVLVAATEHTNITEGTIVIAHLHGFSCRFFAAGKCCLPPCFL